MTKDIKQLEADIADTEARLSRLREAYNAKLLNGTVTRAATTTYNARAGELAARRDELRRMLKLVSRGGRRGSTARALLHAYNAF